MSSKNKLQKPIIYLITEGNLTTKNYSNESRKTLKIIRTAIETDVSMIQIREKKLPSKLVFELAELVIEITKQFQTKVLINDRIDIALATKADGVHLTANSIPTDIIRNRSPKNFMIGVSTHTGIEAKQARDKGADFVTYSPIFPTVSKIHYGDSKGLGKLKKICEELNPFPILALGGINKHNYQKTLEFGASGFASISFLNDKKMLRDLFIQNK